MRNKNTHTTIEGFAIANLKKGECFFTSKSDRSITSWANKAKRKVKTETTICVMQKTLKAQKIYKVTLFN